MSEVFHLDSVDVYNRLFGLETLHPLVSVVDLNKATRGIEVMTMHYGLYALFLKMEKACAYIPITPITDSITPDTDKTTESISAVSG